MIHKKYMLYIILLGVVLGGLWWYVTAQSATSSTPVSQAELDNASVAYFAGGCFWCVESDFEKLNGVLSAVSGYMGGDEENPTYTIVSAGKTGHRESVKVYYNPDVVTYRQLVTYFFKHIDPTDTGGSFHDRGHQYTSAIYVSTDEEKKIAQGVIEEITLAQVFPKPIVTSVERAGIFWPAEEYHQDYYKKNPIRYHVYRNGSGRDAFIQKIWSKGSTLTDDSDRIDTSRWKHFKKPDTQTLKKQLTSIQYRVTQENGTERPFTNAYDNKTDAGIYVDVVSGEPLFASVHKYDSKSGWPSFWRPISSDTIVTKEDKSFFQTRTEVRSRYADSHLGHVFNDGPKPTGLRYCINSAALRFVSKDKMSDEGYSDLLYLFK